MIKKLVLLTKSRKKGGYCTAGIDVETGEWIRIVSDGFQCRTDEILEDQLTYADGNVAQVFDVIEVECIEHRPNYYQPENYVSNRLKRWSKVDHSNIGTILKIHEFENPEHIFYDSSYSILDTDVKGIDIALRHSLVMIKVSNPVINVKTWGEHDKSISISFHFNNSHYKYFRTTDESFNQYCNEVDGNYRLEGDYAFIISLGEPYINDSKHYKLIAKVIKL